MLISRNKSAAAAWLSGNGAMRQLLDLYAEVKPDLEQRIEQAIGPHHLFHMLTEDPGVRLHMTQRLIESA